MSTEQPSVTHPLSRSRLLAGGAAAALGLAAGALTAPREAAGANGAPLILGAENDATAQTAIVCSGATALAANATAAPGLAGTSDTHPGVIGRSRSGFGVTGVTSATAKSGVLGENRDGEGTGVWGRSPSGVGVQGTSRSGTGVRARSNSGVALDVVGSVRFSSAGVAIVRDGEYKVTVSPGVPVTSHSRILATLNGPDPERFVGEAASPILLWFVEARPSDDAFDIALTERVQHDVRVAWFLIDGERP